MVRTLIKTFSICRTIEKEDSYIRISIPRDFAVYLCPKSICYFRIEDSPIDTEKSIEEMKREIEELLEDKDSMPINYFLTYIPKVYTFKLVIDDSSRDAVIYRKDSDYELVIYRYYEILKDYDLVWISYDAISKDSYSLLIHFIPRDMVARVSIEGNDLVIRIGLSPYNDFLRDLDKDVLLYKMLVLDRRKPVGICIDCTNHRYFSSVEEYEAFRNLRENIDLVYRRVVEDAYTIARDYRDLIDLYRSISIKYTDTMFSSKKLPIVKSILFSVVLPKFVQIEIAMLFFSIDMAYHIVKNSIELIARALYVDLCGEKRDVYSIEDLLDIDMDTVYRCIESYISKNPSLRSRYFELVEKLRSISRESELLYSGFVEPIAIELLNKNMRYDRRLSRSRASVVQKFREILGVLDCLASMVMDIDRAIRS